MNEGIIVGKYTLESLTNGMYSDPLDLFREYIQNAVDSIDVALDQQLDLKENFEIQVRVDELAGEIKIHDNGCGVKKSKVRSTLVDIGNSQKDKKKSRGFRGIGRLAGLGYCDELLFTTSAVGENVRSIIRFDTLTLRKLMFQNETDIVSVDDVLSKIITISKEEEDVEKHYFEVILEGVSQKEKLLNPKIVENYLLQHAPVPFDPQFHWGGIIKEKTRILGYEIPEYKILLNGKLLYKPYKNTFICDRVKKREDSIYDVDVKAFYRDEKLTAILWYGVLGFYGTVLDNQIKGIRIRQGNILIGDKTTCNSLFKEDRFNGWLVGELHVIDPELIVNARRDYFEQNEAHYDLSEDFMEWSTEKTRELRKISSERSLEEKSKRIINAEKAEDVNDLMIEFLDINFGEGDLIDRDEAEEVAQTDFIDKLSWILNQKKGQTRYLALNINEKMTTEQKKTLERVFDIVTEEYKKNEADVFINTISARF